jgi:hypothetical protein
MGFDPARGLGVRSKGTTLARVTILRLCGRDAGDMDFATRADDGEANLFV